MIVQNDSLTAAKTRIATIVRHEKQTDIQNNQRLHVISITAYYWRLEI